MSKSVPIQLEEYLRSIAPAWISSGEFQRMPWKNKNGKLATPRTIVRRLEELENDKVIHVEYREHNHAWYSHSKPTPKPKMEFVTVMRDGRPWTVERPVMN